MQFARAQLEGRIGSQTFFCHLATHSCILSDQGLFVTVTTPLYSLTGHRKNNKQKIILKKNTYGKRSRARLKIGG